VEGSKYARGESEHTDLSVKKMLPEQRVKKGVPKEKRGGKSVRKVERQTRREFPGLGREQSGAGRFLVVQLAEARRSLKHLVKDLGRAGLKGERERIKR